MPPGDMLALHAEALVYSLEQEWGEFHALLSKCTEHGSCLIPTSIQTKAKRVDCHNLSGQPYIARLDHGIMTPNKECYKEHVCIPSNSMDVYNLWSTQCVVM